MMPTPPTRLRNQHGLSLIELMVAITVSIILLAGVLQIYISSKQSYRVQEASARLQENGRFAMEFLARDVRVAGYAGCAKRIDETAVGDITYTADQDGNSLPDRNVDEARAFLTDVMAGYENGAGLPAAETPAGLVANTDALRITQAAMVSANVVSMATPSDPIVVTANVTPDTGSLAAVTDCRTTSFFTISDVQPSGANLSVHHDLTVAVSGDPANSTVNLGVLYDDPHAQLVVFQTRTYAIALNPAGKPALFLVTPTATNELIEGVEDMDVLYGVDTDPLTSAGYGTADRYVSGNAIPAGGRIVSARISLLLQTLDTGVAQGPQTYTFPADAAVSTTVNDGLLRRVFTSTVSLRNVTP